MSNAKRHVLNAGDRLKLQVFAGVFPIDQSHFVELQTAIGKLTLNDPSVEINKDNRFG